MRKSIPFLAFAVSLLCCCGKTPETPVTPTPAAPTAITLSPTSLSAAQAAAKLAADTDYNRRSLSAKEKNDYLDYLLGLEKLAYSGSRGRA